MSRVCCKTTNMSQNRKKKACKLSVEESLAESIHNLDKTRIRQIIQKNPGICTRKGVYPLIILMHTGEAGFHSYGRLEEVFEVGDILINEGGADVNAFYSDTRCTAAVSIAARLRSVSKLKFLLDRGAHVHSSRWKITSEGYPLFLVIRRSHVFLVNMVLRHGADPNAKDEDSGNSTLYYAISIMDGHREERRDICNILIQMGAQVNQHCFYFDERLRKNVRGSALCYALSVAGTDQELILLLKQMGAQRRIVEWPVVV